MKRSRWFAVAGVAAALCFGADVPAATDAAPAGALVNRQTLPRAAAADAANAPTSPPVSAPLPDALPHTTRVTQAVLTRIVTAALRAVISYEVKLGITQLPSGIISRVFDTQIRALVNRCSGASDARRRRRGGGRGDPARARRGGGTAGGCGRRPRTPSVGVWRGGGCGINNVGAITSVLRPTVAKR